jgi:hypothetical protein
MGNIRREDGIALVVALMAMLLMTALGAALILATTSESLIAGNFRGAVEGLHAADAALERAIDDLPAVADWNLLLGGSAQSAFVDGPPGGVRALPDGSTLDLGGVLNTANCQKAAACSASDLVAITADRPWGPNNPVWQLYAYGPLATLLAPGVVGSDFYVVVMVGDDPSETDDDPLHDGGGESNPGAGVLSLRAEAFGPHGAHKVIEMTVARVATAEPGHAQPGQERPGDPIAGAAGEQAKGGVANGGPGVRIVSWREVR